MRTLVLLPCLLAACTTNVEFDDLFVDAEVGDVEVDGAGKPEDPETPVPTPDGEGIIVEAGLGCTADGIATYEAIADGLVAGGRIYQVETGNSNMHWTENHTLEVGDPDDDGLGIRVERILLDGRHVYGPDEQETDFNTLFECENHLLYPGVMTFAYAVEDLSGAIVDCIVFGEDPEELITPTEDRVYEPDFDLAQCRIVPSSEVGRAR